MYGDFLTQLRTSRTMTQAQLAAVSGVSQPNISAYENDRRVPTLDVLNRLMVSCGYQLVADGGSKQVRSPFPKVGWFPDDDYPPALPDDPAPQTPPVPIDATPDERAEALTSLLDLADAFR